MVWTVAMTTTEFAERLAESLGLSEKQQNELYRALLLFQIWRTDGYWPDEGPRREAYAYAQAHGVYWLPCIICGQWRGGHEPMAFVQLTGDLAQAVCCNCAPEALRINSIFPGGIDVF